MRLKQQEVNAIKECVREADVDARVYLFGSRTDDSKRGGDIDLLVLSRKIDAGMRRKLKLRLYDRLGEQKIDVVISGGDMVDPFTRVVLQEGVAL